MNFVFLNCEEKRNFNKKIENSDEKIFTVDDVIF